MQCDDFQLRDGQLCATFLYAYTICRGRPAWLAQRKVADMQRGELQLLMRGGDNAWVLTKGEGPQ